MTNLISLWFTFNLTNLSEISIESALLPSMLKRGNFIYFFPFFADAALTFASCFSFVVFRVTFLTDSLNKTVEFFEPGIEPFKYKNVVITSTSAKKIQQRVLNEKN